MLRLTVFELIARVIPEAFVFILATYALSNRKLNVNRYIISSFILAMCVYAIRMLPIHPGIHTILNIIMQTVIVININKIYIIQAIKSALISSICLFILEGVNVLALNIIFKYQLETILLDPTSKIIYSLPSLVCFAIIISCYYVSRKGRMEND